MKIILLILLSTSLFGIRNNTIYENGVLKFSTGNLHEIRDDVENSVRDYLNDIKTELGHKSPHEFPLLKQNAGFGDSEHLVFQQTKNGIPVMGHIGLLPQHSFNFKHKGKNNSQKKKIYKDAEALTNAGAFAIVIECVVESLAKKITNNIRENCHHKTI